MVKLILLAITATLAAAELYLDKLDRRILKEGLHRILQTDVTFTVTKNFDFDHCNYIFRETITQDMYIYYEEVTRDMPGFETWPHHEKMDIEIPASIAKPFTFVWKLPLKERAVNSYIKKYESTDMTVEPQTVSLTVEFPFHFRYQPV